MDCEHRIIYNKNEKVCNKCGTIFDYLYSNEVSFRDYNITRANSLLYKKSIYKRKKYLYKICFHIRPNENIINFLNNSLEDIRKTYNLKRIAISKYLNSLYKFYCNKCSLEYKPILNKKIIVLDENIINILEKNYLLYPFVYKNEDHVFYL